MEAPLTELSMQSQAAVVVTKGRQLPKVSYRRTGPVWVEVPLRGAVCYVYTGWSMKTSFGSAGRMLVLSHGL